jgi:hypothetical protein
VERNRQSAQLQGALNVKDIQHAGKNRPDEQQEHKSGDEEAEGNIDLPRTGGGLFLQLFPESTECSSNDASKETSTWIIPTPALIRRQIGSTRPGRLATVRCVSQPPSAVTRSPQQDQEASGGPGQPCSAKDQNCDLEQFDPTLDPQNHTGSQDDEAITERSYRSQRNYCGLV